MSRLTIPALFALLVSSCGGEDPLPFDTSVAAGAPVKRAPVQHVLSVHGFSSSADGIRVENPIHGLVVTFRADGLHLRDPHGAWTARYRLTRFGRPAALHTVAVASPVTAPCSVAGCSERVEYDRGALADWYVNTIQGIEQRIDLNDRPLGVGPVVVEAVIDGDVSIESAPDAGGTVVARHGDTTVFTLSALTVRDASGTPLPASIEVSGDTVQYVIDDQWATWPLEVDPPLGNCPSAWCSDGDPSTVDVCGAGGQSCEHLFDPAFSGKACDSGQFCCPDGFYADVCALGVVLGSCPSGWCNDGQPGTIDTCSSYDIQTGAFDCSHEYDTSLEGTPCSYGLHCCDDGKFHEDCGPFDGIGTDCPGGWCNDGDPTTLDICSGYIGKTGQHDCSHTFDPDAEGQPCTYGAYCCGDGLAHADCDGPPPEGCQAVGETCDDEDPCTEHDECAAEGVGFVCEGTPVVCPAAGTCEESACDPATGACEVTDAADGAACDDTNPCTTADECVAGTCTGGPVDCSALDTSCTHGLCNPASGVCAAVAVPDGTLCDDSDPCTTLDACSAGACAGPPVDCSALDTDCASGVCDAATGQCTATPAPDGTPCDDGDLCSAGDSCDAGVCAAGPIPLCGVCSGGSPGDACDDGNPCTSNDACTNAGGLLVCVGAPTDCSHLDTDCSVGICDPVGGCHALAFADGTLCTDGDACTAFDSCQGGVCSAGVNLCGACVGKAAGDPCDDGSGCTSGDACAVSGPLLACVGAPKDCSALSTSCLIGHCVSASGACEASPKPDGVLCDDGDGCTTGDACLGGLCTSSTNTCTDCLGLPPGTSCNDGDPCTQNDVCMVDSAGVVCAGATVDCGHLSSTCSAGVCDPTTGGCVADPTSEGAACDDADPCTDGDTCTAGACAAAVDLCAPCIGLGPGDACDDGDLCSTGDACVAALGVVRCESTPTDCTHLDVPCNAGVCDPADGSCTTTPADGTCDDGDACTASDMCVAGSCTGTTHPICGDPYDGCEPPAPNDTPATATPLTLLAGAVTTLVHADPAGEVDYFALDLTAGQVLTAETLTHCGTPFDTSLAVYDPTGALLAFDADSGVSAFSRIAGLTITATGTHTIATLTDPLGGTGTYLLRLQAP